MNQKIKQILLIDNKFDDDITNYVKKKASIIFHTFGNIMFNRLQSKKLVQFIKSGTLVSSEYNIEDNIRYDKEETLTIVNKRGQFNIIVMKDVKGYFAFVSEFGIPFLRGFESEIDESFEYNGFSVKTVKGLIHLVKIVEDFIFYTKIIHSLILRLDSMKIEQIRKLTSQQVKRIEKKIGIIQIE
jgi:hypothetical protein